jgi:hypothetical protein
VKSSSRSQSHSAYRRECKKEIGDGGTAAAPKIIPIITKRLNKEKPSRSVLLDRPPEAYITKPRINRVINPLRGPDIKDRFHCAKTLAIKPTAASTRIIERPFRLFLAAVFVLTFNLPKAAFLVAHRAALPAANYPLQSMPPFYNTCPACVSLSRFSPFLGFGCLTSILVLFTRFDASSPRRSEDRIKQ